MGGRAVGIALALIWLLNYVDAIFTLAWVHLGVALEANPLMAEIITNPAAFLAIKITIVTLGCILLWRFKEFALSQYMILIALICYLAILGIHTNIALSLEQIPYEQVKECLENHA